MKGSQEDVLRAGAEWTVEVARLDPDGAGPPRSSDEMLPEPAHQPHCRLWGEWDMA